MSSKTFGEVARLAAEAERAEELYFEAREWMSAALRASGHLGPMEETPILYNCASWRERDGRMESRAEGADLHLPTDLRFVDRVPHLGLAVARSAACHNPHAMVAIPEQVFVFSLAAEEAPGRG